MGTPTIQSSKSHQEPSIISPCQFQLLVSRKRPTEALDKESGH